MEPAALVEHPPQATGRGPLVQSSLMHFVQAIRWRVPAIPGSLPLSSGPGPVPGVQSYRTRNTVGGPAPSPAAARQGGISDNADGTELDQIIGQRIALSVEDQN